MTEKNKVMIAAKDLAATAAKWNTNRYKESASVINNLAIEKKSLLEAMGYTVNFETNAECYVTAVTVDGERAEIKCENGLAKWIVEKI